jgi:methyltransferase (TIGR00027 family)
MADAEIRNVSDTALLVAACRAIETARADGLVRDPFAEQLAGERGMAMARSTPRSDIMCFGIGIRSRWLDELVMHAITRRGAGIVLCLGAGLDTRPWRLDLPESLRWIEVDLPEMVDYKAAAMAGHAPKCRLERMPADLNDAAGRSAVFAAVGETPALMITEGLLLMYLPADTVEGLACEAARTPAIQSWLLDVTSADFARRIHQGSDANVQRVSADSHLEGGQIQELLERHGWRAVERRSYTTDAYAAAPERVLALARAYAPGGQVTAPPANDPSGVDLYGRC